MKESIIVIFENEKTNEKVDIEVPLNITANELIYGLNEGLHLGMQLNQVKDCYLCTENPIALLRGNTVIEKFKLRDGTVIRYQG